MLSINTNINNLKLQSNLSTVNFAMQQALEKMSTGYRINNASDDAAGLVISKALSVQASGLNVANQNAQMATNILNVTDGALSQMNDLAMRIRDLALQSANSGYSTVEHTALNQEAKELTNSLEQLVNGTKFNDFKIFTSENSKKGIITEEEAVAQGYTIIKTADELQSIKDGNLSGKYILMNDVDLSSIPNWQSIGTSVGDAFRGVFDGNGFTISNLTIDKTVKNQGLFGYGYNATIQNVNLENTNVKGGDYTGGLIGYADYTTIKNCALSGNIVGKSRTGGLVGEGAYNTISNSYFKGTVKGTDRVGGMIGCAYGTNSAVLNCYSEADIYSESGAGATSSFGGLVGYTYNTKINNSYSTGQVLATTGYRGGFIGQTTGTTNSLNNSFVAQTGSYNSVGSGTTPSNIAQRTADWFVNTENQKSILGDADWDFSGGVPKLKWQIKPKNPNIITFQIGTDGTQNSELSINTSFSLEGFNINLLDANSSRSAITSCDSILKLINTKRANVGANSNIINSIIEGNTITNENLTSSKSRIQDADIAKESANMVKNQILQNATTALLAQSQNVSGNLALQLLNGIKR